MAKQSGTVFSDFFFAGEKIIKRRRWNEWNVNSYSSMGVSKYISLRDEIPTHPFHTRGVLQCDIERAHKLAM